MCWDGLFLVWLEWMLELWLWSPELVPEYGWWMGFPFYSPE